MSQKNLKTLMGVLLAVVLFIGNFAGGFNSSAVTSAKIIIPRGNILESGTDNQKWIFEAEGADYRIRNKQTGTYLTYQAPYFTLASKSDSGQFWEISFNQGFNIHYINVKGQTNNKLGIDMNGYFKLEWNPWGADYSVNHDWCKINISTSLTDIKTGVETTLKTVNGNYFEAYTPNVVASAIQTDADDQNWVFEYIGTGTKPNANSKEYYIKNKKTGLYLTTTSILAGGKISLETQNDTLLQKWSVYVEPSDGTFYIYQQWTHFIDTNQDDTIGLTASQNYSQRYKLQGFSFDGQNHDSTIKHNSSGKFFSSQSLVDEPAPVTEKVNGSLVANGLDGQKWVFEYNSDATQPASAKIYYIRNKESGLYLTASASNASGTFDLQAKKQGLLQLWSVFYDAAYSQYYISIHWTFNLTIDSTGTLKILEGDYPGIALNGFTLASSNQVCTMMAKQTNMYFQKYATPQTEPQYDEAYGVASASGTSGQDWIFEPGTAANSYFIKNVLLNKYLTRSEAEVSKSLFAAPKGVKFQEWYIQYDTQYSHYYISSDSQIARKLSILKNGAISTEQNWTGQDMCLLLSKTLEETKSGTPVVIHTRENMYLEATAYVEGPADIAGSFGEYLDDTYTSGMYGKTVDAFNLLSNGGFEKETKTWGAIFGGIDYKAVKDSEIARSGEYVLLATNAKAEYSTPSTSIGQIIRQYGDGYYQMGVYVKAVEGELAANFSMNMVLQNALGLIINGVAITQDGQANNLVSRTAQKDERGYHKIFTTFKIENSKSLSGSANLSIWQGKASDFYMDDCFLFFTNENLIDGGFEGDNLPTLPPFGEGVVVAKDPAVFNSGSSSLKITNVTTKENAPAFDITSIIKAKGSGVYEFGTYAKALKGKMECFGVRLVIEGDGALVNGSTPDANGYFGFVEINDRQFTRAMRTVLIENTANITRAYLSFYPGEERAFYIDDVFLRYYFTDSNGGGYQSSVAQSIADRDEKTAVGAIRWDYWGTHESQNIYAQNLNKPEFLWRLPWYAQVDRTKGTVVVPDYTQDIIDKEISYASKAGLDYWAFVMYKEPSNKALELYLNSSKKNDIKWVAILGLSDWWFTSQTEMDAKIQWLKTEMYKPNYQKVQNGRPLIYAQAGYATMIRRECKDMEKQPYIVSLLHNEDIETAKGNDVDAVSAYTQFASGENGSVYQNIIDAAPAKWNLLKDSTVQMIPNVTTGWDPRPRFENGITVSGKAWNQNATAKEISKNLENALIWVDENKNSTLSNAILMYAWNELDEGGWIMPTYQPDNPGVPDMQRLNAIQMILNTKDPTVIVTSESESDKAVIGMPIRMVATLLSDTLRGKTVTWSVRPLTGNGTIDSKTGLFNGNKVGTVIVRATVNEIPQYFADFTLKVMPYTGDLYEKILFMQTIDGTKYPLDAWIAFQKAIDQAVDVIENENSQQAQMNEQIAALDAALSSLKNAKFPSNPVVELEEEPQADPDPTTGRFITMEELDKVISNTTGKYLKFKVHDIGIITIDMIKKIIDTKKPLRIEYLDAQDGVILIFEFGEFKTPSKDIDLSVLTDSGQKAAIDRFFGENPKIGVSFKTPSTIDANLRIYIPNKGLFSKNQKIQLFETTADGKNTMLSKNPVGITSDEAYLSFATNSTGDYAISTMSIKTDKGAVDGTKTASTNNPLLGILLAVAVVILLAGGVVGGFKLFRNKKASGITPESNG